MAVGALYSTGLSGLLTFYREEKCFKNQYKVEIETILLIIGEKDMAGKRSGDKKSLILQEKK